MSESPMIYLSADWETGGPTLVCERAECETDGTWHEEALPFKATPEQAAEARDAHLATHQRRPPRWAAADEVARELGLPPYGIDPRSGTWSA